MNTNKFESAIFSDYAFVGWVWTIAISNRHVVAPGTRTVSEPVCPPEFAWLGDTPFGWRFDAALRKGWGMLGPDALAFCNEHLRPLCSPWLLDMLEGRMISR